MRNFLTALFLLFLFLPMRVMAQPHPGAPLSPVLQTLGSAMF
jgi:hypothetical protein